jgi:molybdopterin-synthase adenylyltransferase
MKKIVIVGLGALGSHAALALRNIGSLRLVDFDKVEQKNTLAQFHTKQSLRRNKAQALAQVLQGMWGVRAEAMPHKLTEPNAATFLAGADIVLDCTDNIAARTAIKAFCDANDIPLLHAAMSADGLFAQITWTESFEADPETGDGATCEDGVNLPFHVLVGGFVAQAVKTFFLQEKRQNFSLTPSGVMRV